MSNETKTEPRDRPANDGAAKMWRGCPLPSGLTVEMAEKIERLIEGYEDDERLAYEVVLAIWGIVNG
jgi:hypothetical protein